MKAGHLNTQKVNKWIDLTITVTGTNINKDFIKMSCKYVLLLQKAAVM